MKTFIKFCEEYDGHNPAETRPDPAEMHPDYEAHLTDWCRRHPHHPECAQNSLSDLRAANTTDLKELPGAAGEAAHARLHSVIEKILKKSGA